MIYQNESRRKQLFPNVSDADWNDWHWQVANRAETLEDLKKYITLTPEEEEGVKACLGTLRMAITPYYLSLIDPDDPHDPIRKQAIPTAKELHQSPADLLDPLHEDSDSPVPGLTHRYPDRVLLLTTDQCSMYCRHCTRRRFAGQHDTSVPVEQIDQCIAYIHPGDPCRPGCPSLRRRRADALRRDAGVHHLPPAGDPPCGDHPTGLPHAGGVPPAYHPQTVRHAQEVPPRVAQHPLQPSKGDHQGGRRGLRPSGRRRCASGQPVRAARRCERLRPHHEEAGPNAGPDPGTALLRTTPRCRCPLPCR